MPANYIAFDMYRKIKRLSGNDHIVKQTSKGQMTLMLPRITHLYEILDRYLPDISDYEQERLITKINIIHVKNINNILNG